MPTEASRAFTTRFRRADSARRLTRCRLQRPLALVQSARPGTATGPPTLLTDETKQSRSMPPAKPNQRGLLAISTHRSATCVPTNQPHRGRRRSRAPTCLADGVGLLGTADAFAGVRAGRAETDESRPSDRTRSATKSVCRARRHRLTKASTRLAPSHPQTDPPDSRPVTRKRVHRTAEKYASSTRQRKASQARGHWHAHRAMHACRARMNPAMDRSLAGARIGHAALVPLGQVH